MEMDAKAVIEKARQVFDIEIEGLAAVRDQLGDGFVNIPGTQTVFPFPDTV